MTLTLSFMCLLILLPMFCFSFEHSLHGDKNEASSVEVVVSNAKAMKHNDDDAMKKLQEVGGRSSSGEEYSKEMTKMKKTTKKEKSVDLVAYTADYWKPRHHPPKNN